MAVEARSACSMSVDSSRLDVNSARVGILRGPSRTHVRFEQTNSLVQMGRRTLLDDGNVLLCRHHLVDSLMGSDRVTKGVVEALCDFRIRATEDAVCEEIPQNPVRI